MEPTETIIDRFYVENSELIELLKRTGEVSLLAVAEKNFSKNLLLSVASYFETYIRDLLINFVTNKSNENIEIISFVKAKAIERQYHTYFDWKTARNVNMFLAFFGEDFKASVSQDMQTTIELQQGMLAFLELGRDRNTLVHENFVTFSLEKTSSDIYAMYKKAFIFVSYLSLKFGVTQQA